MRNSAENDRSQYGKILEKELKKCLYNQSSNTLKHMKSYGHITHLETQNVDLTACYNMLATIIDSDFFEYLGAKEYIFFHSKEIATDTTHLLSQMIKRLRKVLGFNMLDYCNDIAIELYPLFLQVNFSDDLNELFNYMCINGVTSSQEEEKAVKLKRDTYSITVNARSLDRK